MTDDCPDRLSSRRQIPMAGIELAPCVARAGQDANRLEIVDREVDYVCLTGPAGRANDPAGSKAERNKNRLTLE
jgi:hypothetical protein